MADQETSSASPGPGLTPQGELSQRLEILLEGVLAERGQPVSFREISGALADRGVKMSRARWSYMKDGNGSLISDRPLLTALADYFKVSPDYLLIVEDMETPEVAWEQRESVRSLRAAKVKSFVGQTLGDVSSETLQDVTDYLNGDRPLPPEAEAVGDYVDSPDEPPVVP
jgi:hypothetical protein